MASILIGEIITTGSELVLGRTVDTNSAWLSETLSGQGVRVVRHTSVGDDLPRLAEAFRRAWTDCQVTVVTGGLGPTEDDLTRQAAAEAFGRELEYHEELAVELRAMFIRRGYDLTDNNLRQMWWPRGALVVPNPLGTAPGFALAENDRLMVFLPGVPPEMKRMVNDWLLPHLKTHFPVAGGVIKTVVLKTGGLGESMVDQLVGDLMGCGHNPEVSLLASPDTVRVVVTAEAHNEEELETIMAPTVAELEKRLEGHIFGWGATTLAEAVAELLKKNNLRLVILDAVTRSRLSGYLTPYLAPENWAGSQDMPWQPALSGAREILRLYAPDSENPHISGSPRGRGYHQGEIRLITTAQPAPETSSSSPHELHLVLESAVHGVCMNGGEPQIKKFHLGGPRNWTLKRAAFLSCFHFWQVLRKYKPDAAAASSRNFQAPALEITEDVGGISSQ